MIEIATSNKQLNFKYGKKNYQCSLLLLERKTMEISVHPDCSIVVKAPFDSDIDLIKSKINKRVKWIVRQIIYFKQFSPKTPPKSYVNGETHLYLGKQYRLKIKEGKIENTKLKRGQFLVVCKNVSDSSKIHDLMYDWYKEKALLHYKNSFDRCFLRFKSFDINKPTMNIKQLSRNWGALSDNNILSLNIELIKSPKECIDYVITHEICHLLYKNHSKEFFKLLESVLPDWKRIKHKLEITMS